MGKVHKSKSKKIVKRRKKKRKLVYRGQDFQSYILWKSLPTILRGQQRPVLKGLGIDEELAISLLEIKNQTEFTKKFRINKYTLTIWNKKIEENNLLVKSRNFWAKKLTSNVLMALYRKAVTEGDTNRVRLWYELVEGLKSGGFPLIAQQFKFTITRGKGKEWK